MNKKQALELLKNNPVFWSRLGFSYDPPLYHENGTLIVFNPTFSEAETHASFTAADVRIHTCILRLGWVGVNKYDYSLSDRVLKEIFENGKAEYFIPRITLNVPVDWCRENPEEITVFQNGPRDAEEIRALVGTLRQDYLGYRSEKGYYNSNGWQDTRPNVDCLISRQSFSSKKWIEDASEALKRLIDHIESSPYGDRILAYHIAYGACGESMMWGRQSSSMWGDYGIAHQRHFYNYALRKHGSREAILEAWGLTSLDGDIVPPPHLREKAYHKTNDLYRDEAADRWSIDYDRFMSEINVDALEAFGRVVKENTGDKPVGAFYGYVVHMARTPYTGHLGWKRLLDSPYVDFFAAPKSYYRCGPGEPGGEMAPTVSINKRKLWLDECDNRTHLSNEASQSPCANADETHTVLLRELCKNISHDSGLWYMDLGGNWYADTDLMRYVSTLIHASEEVRKQPHESVAEIAVIIDEESILFAHPDTVRPAENLLRELQLTGAPIDVIFSYDIDRIDLSKIRLAVLLHSCRLDSAYLDRLRQAAPRARVLSFGRVGADMGVSLLEVDGEKIPEYRIAEDKGVIPIFKDENGLITVAENAKKDIIAATYRLSTLQLRTLVEQADVHCYAPVGCAVYADNRILSFFPKDAAQFVPAVDKNTALYDLLSARPYDLSQPLSLPARGGVAFRLF